jgi:hypothetical protein
VLCSLRRVEVAPQTQRRAPHEQHLHPLPGRACVRRPTRQRVEGRVGVSACLLHLTAAQQVGRQHPPRFGLCREVAGPAREADGRHGVALDARRGGHLQLVPGLAHQGPGHPPRVARRRRHASQRQQGLAPRGTVRPRPRDLLPALLRRRREAEPLAVAAVAHQGQRAPVRRVAHVGVGGLRGEPELEPRAGRGPLGPCGLPMPGQGAPRGRIVGAATLNDLREARVHPRQRGGVDGLQRGAGEGRVGEGPTTTRVARVDRHQDALRREARPRPRPLRTAQQTEQLGVEHVGAQGAPPQKLACFG